MSNLSLSGPPCPFGIAYPVLFWQQLGSLAVVAVSSSRWTPAIPTSSCRVSGPQALGPSCYLSFTDSLLSVNIHLAGHKIIGSPVFVLLPRGFIWGLRGPFKHTRFSLLPANNVTCFGICLLWALHHCVIHILFQQNH